MGSITVSSLGKAYKIYPSRFARLKEWLIPFSKPRHSTKWVLQDLNFKVSAGEAVGIIGVNGAGKSTLLKMLTGTTQPTTGSVEITGRVAALLELGMGFHPEFTGRQNAYMAGQLLGFSVTEIESEMAAIEIFAEIGLAIDDPVRTYSSGMQVRLAFAVATAIRPDILIVDEALSVGDVFFQQKCYERINSFIESGTTLLFVSHSFDAVYSLCERAILLENGYLALDSNPKKVIDYYQSYTLANKVNIENHKQDNTSLSSEILGIQVDEDGTLRGEVELLDIHLMANEKETSVLVANERAYITLRFTFSDRVNDPHVGFQIRNARGEPVFMTNTHALKTKIGTRTQGSIVNVTFGFDVLMAPGNYSITIGVAEEAVFDIGFSKQLARLQNMCAFSVVPNAEHYRWSGQCDLGVSAEVS